MINRLLRLIPRFNLLKAQAITGTATELVMKIKYLECLPPKLFHSTVMSLLLLVCLFQRRKQCIIEKNYQLI